MEGQTEENIYKLRNDNALINITSRYFIIITISIIVVIIIIV